MLDGLLPEIHDATLACFRSAYGVLLLAHLLASLPHARRFFLSERWGGYGKSARSVDLVQNPYVLPVLLVLWLASALGLTLGWWPVPAAGINLLLCRYFFLHMRWRGVLRGMGAPGFICNWLATALFLLLGCQHYARSLLPLALLVVQVDFALIMFVAGWYKLNAGYFQNEGMEYGLVNPEWSFWWRQYRRLPAGHWWYRCNNHLAWAGEIIAGTLMLIPATRFWGALFIALSFVYLAVNLRLLVLAPMVAIVALLFCTKGTLGELALLSILPSTASPDAIALPGVQLLAGALIAYLILLPFVYGGLFYNFYSRRSLPGVLQPLLDRYANCFGFILWRVFTADIVNFFIRIYRLPATGNRVLITDWATVGGWRFDHVAEAIAVTSLFTTRKYYPSDRRLFEERLLRYARTLLCPPGDVLIFEHVLIRKQAGVFADAPIVEYRVDPAAATVTEEIIDRSQAHVTPHRHSPIHEGSRPGSYAPAGR